MSSSESIHHVSVGIRSQFLGEFLLRNLHSLLGLIEFGSAFLNANRLTFLLGIVAQVLQQQSLAHLQGSSLFRSIGTIGSKLHVNTEGLANGGNNLLQ